MTVTVPTLALVLPFMAVWVVGYLIVASAEWDNRLDSMLLDGVTPRRFIRDISASMLVGFFWPLVIVLRACRGALS